MSRVEEPEVGATVPEREVEPGVRRSSGWRAYVTPLAMRLPSLLAIALLIVFPLVYSLNLSFREFSLLIPGRDGQWIGLDNYRRMIHDSAFGSAIGRTVLFSVVAVALETVLGTLLAVGLDRLSRYRRLLTSILIVPMIMTPLVVGLVFNFAFNAQFGFFTWAFGKLGLFDGAGVLDKGGTAMAALIAVDVWQWTPFVTLMVMAGLKALPEAPFQAAKVDGAHGWRLFRHITLPMLWPILGIAIMFRITEAVREFDKVYVLTGGGPGSSTVVNDLFQYRVSFNNFDFSYGATLGLATFAAVLFLCAMMLRSLSKREA